MNITLGQRLAAWSVHTLTASAAIIGLYALYAIMHGDIISAFWCMAATIFIDAIDGGLARLCRVNINAARIDGAALDNIVDYFNYAIVPAFFLVVNTALLPETLHVWLIGALVLASSYQFSQRDAKTADNFFRGFPCYWNLMVFYMYILETSAEFNSLVIVVLVIAVFVPSKYVYPSRMDNLSKNPWIRRAIGLATISYGLTTAALLWLYPQTNNLLVNYALYYMTFYFLVSFYRSYYPLR